MMRVNETQSLSRLNLTWKFNFLIYTRFYRMKGGGALGAPPPQIILNNKTFPTNYTSFPPPPPPNNFEQQNFPNKLYIVEKGIWRRIRFILNFGKMFWFSDFVSGFRDFGQIWAIFERLKDIRLFECLYIILRLLTHVGFFRLLEVFLYMERSKNHEKKR